MGYERQPSGSVSIDKLDGSISGEPQAISVRIYDQHFARPPCSVFWPLCRVCAASAEVSIAGIDIRNFEVNRATYLAVTTVLRQEDRLASARDLQEEWKSWLKLMLPVDREAQAVNIESQAASRVRNSELWNDRLHQEASPLPSNEAVQ
jgi:hypothetical protein